MTSSDLISLPGLAALITALATGVGGTWLALKKFKLDRTKGQIDIEAALRAELRTENSALRKELSEIREGMNKIFQENLDLKHENNNNRMKIRSLESQVAKLATEQNRHKSKQPKPGKKKPNLND